MAITDIMNISFYLFTDVNIHNTKNSHFFKTPSKMAPESQLIRCLLCELVTVEATLEIHIKYNHLIYKESILKVKFSKKILCLVTSL